MPVTYHDEQPKDINQAFAENLMLKSGTGGDLPVLGIPGGINQLPSSSPEGSVGDLVRPSLEMTSGILSRTPVLGALATPTAENLSDVFEGLSDPTGPKAKELLNRTLLGTLGENAKQSALGAGLTYFANKVPGAVGKVLTTGKRPGIVQAAENAAARGIELPLGSSTGAPILTGMQHELERAPFSKNTIADAFEKAGQQLESATESSLGAIGPKETKEVVGTRLQKQLQTTKDALEANNDVNFQAVRDAFENPIEKFSATEVQKTANELLKKEQALTTKNKGLISTLKSFAGTDQTLTPEIIEALSPSAQAELGTKFISSNLAIENLSGDAKAIYENLGPKAKAQFLNQLTPPQVTKEMISDALSGQKVGNVLKKLSASTQNEILQSVAPKFDWDTLYRQRTALYNEVGKALQSGDRAHAEALTKLAKTFRNDMEGIVNQQGAQAKSAFQKADKEFAQYADIFREDPQIQKILSETEPEKIRAYVTGKDSMNFVKKLKATVGEGTPAFDSIRRQYAEAVLGTPEKDLDAVIGSGTLKEILSPQELKDLNELRKTTEFVTGEIKGNVPESFMAQHGHKLLSLGTGGVAYLMTGDPKKAAGAGLGVYTLAPPVLAKLFLNPEARALILQGAKAAPKTAEGLKIASRLVTLAGVKAGQDLTNQEPDINSALGDSFQSP